MQLLEPGQLNTYDVLISDDVVFTQGALEAFLGGPATGRSAKGAASSLEAEAEVVADEVVEEQVVEDQVVEEKPPAKAAGKHAAPADESAEEEQD